MPTTKSPAKATSKAAVNAKKKTLSKRKPSRGDRWRPVVVTMRATFPKEGGRRVTPADLDRAASAAAAAFRASLEGRSPAYDVVDLTATVNYSYVQHETTIDLGETP